MLRRAASSRHARGSLHYNLLNSYRQIHLPFLCPAFANQSVRNYEKPSFPHNVRRRPRSRRSSYSTPTSPQKSGLATAGPSTASFLDDVPFDSLSPDYGRHLANPSGGHQSWQLGSRNLVIMPLQPPPVSQVRAAPKQPFTSNLLDLQTNLYACLRVGRLERAAALVQRIAYVYVSDAPEVIDAHERYLFALLDRVEESPKKETFMDMQRWLELEIKGRETPLSAHMLVAMVRGTLLAYTGKRMERTLRRYLFLADQAGVSLDVDSSGLFSDEEWVQITRLQPDKYYNPTEVVEEPSMDSSNSALQIAQQLESSRAPSQLVDSVITPTQEFSDLKATDQKGGSLQNLMSTLSPLDEWRAKMRSTGKLSDNALKDLQIRLEKGVIDATIARWREEAQQSKTHRITSAASFGTLSYQWVRDMVPLLEEELEFGEQAETGELGAQNSSASAERLLITPFLRMAAPEKLCSVAIIQFLRVVAGGELRDIRDEERDDKHIKLSNLVGHMGRSIVQEMKFHDFTKDMSAKKRISAARRRDLQQMLRKRQMNLQEGPQHGDQDAENSEADILTHTNIPTEISTSTAIKLGASFLSWILKVARLPVTTTDPKSQEVVTQWQPAATHGTSYERGRKFAVVKVNLELLKRLNQEPSIAMSCKSLPMVVKPKPWADLDDGAYFTTSMKAVRFKDPTRNQEAHVKLASKRGDMKQVYEALDSLGSVPWTINQPLFQAMTEVWNSGKEAVGFAPADFEPEYPAKPPSGDVEAYRSWRDQVNQINNKVYSYHSQRCYQNLQLETAKSYLGLKFYTPHSIDFRGRAYPIPPYLNHMGADLTRGLFLFANGRPLTEKGLSWLKIHVANTFGYDKQSLREREAFTMAHLTQIYDSAANPTTGQRWWMSAEDPWQCLAACMELKGALESPVPEEYISHLPIQQDGTCNGLQHYAALGGDEIGARQVNLAPGDRPADVYSAVADLVREQVKEDATNGSEIAEFMLSRITRKIVKQPVMTNVYGVTFYGARAQVRRQLIASIKPDELPEGVTHGTAAGYIAQHIFKALARMFEGASAIQEWLGKCGEAISQAVTPEQVQRIKLRKEGKLVEKEVIRQKLSNSRARIHRGLTSDEEDCTFKSTIVWTTPLGLPVVQPYRESKTSSIVTSLAELYYTEPTVADPVSKRRQLQAFPPNFIHSLDATHMMLSALKCEEMGITFASVHDSFWTHAADVPNMNRILRDSFVRMHAEDVVGRLQEEFTARYKGCLQIVYVASDSTVGKRITHLRRQRARGKFGPKFSGNAGSTHIEELCEEYERLEMLRSDDSAVRGQAAQMVTPYSIYEQDTEGSEVMAKNEFRVRSFANSHEEARSTRNNNEDTSAEVDADSLLDQTMPDSIAQPIAEADGSTSHLPAEEQTQKVGRPKSKRKAGLQTYFWMPLTFPDPPSKGSFNVAELKDSQYFFS